MSDAIGYAVRDGVCYLKLSGELRHDSAGPLDALVERLYEQQGHEFSAVAIDLNQAVFMDSTVIGLLAGTAREQLARGLAAPTVFSTNPEINQLLQSLRLDEVFNVVEQATAPGAQDDKLSACEAQQCSAAGILRAHETLVELNEANRDKFQSVIDLFRDECEP